MDRIFWIYISSLALCFAISYRVWQAEEASVKRNRVERIKTVVLQDLKEQYSVLESALLYSKKRNEMKVDNYKILSIATFLFEKKEVEQLRDLCLEVGNDLDDYRQFHRVVNEGKIYTEVEFLDLLGEEIGRYYYMNLMLGHIYNNRNKDQLENLTIDAKAVDLKGLHENIIGYTFDIYSEIGKEVDVKYQLDGKRLPILNGGAATHEFPNNIKASYKNSVTGEVQSWRSNKIKA